VRADDRATQNDVRPISGYVETSFDVSSYAGRTITMNLTGVETD
jgi:hypothetical protein